MENKRHEFVIRIIKAEKAQEEYCEQKGLPMLAPYGGFCTNCGKNIYEHVTVESAGRHLITGCPFCHHSFCD